MEKLGIDPILILFQVINFLILLYILKRVLYQPILTILERRRTDVVKIEETKAELENAKNAMVQEKDEIIRQARIESEKLISVATQRSEQFRRQFEAETKQKANELLEKTKSELEVKAASIRGEISQEMSQVAILVAEKALGEKITDEQKQTILHDAVRRFVEK
jgi:F-type H+-transporting ATPase subunit b